MAEVDEDYFIPLQDQRVFGAGIKRKRVHFIPAVADASVISPKLSKPPVGDRYLSIVMPLARSENDHLESTEDRNEEADLHRLSSTDSPICQICNLPIPRHATNSTSPSRPHEASITHQVCLTHSHPPSHLERSRPGLRYLSSYGWDPDSRLGLGARGEGIRTPIKPKVKANTVGLGAGVPGRENSNSQHATEPRDKLNAKRTRERDAESKLKRDSLQELFYGNDDVEKYLGPGKWTRGFLRGTPATPETASG